MENAFTRIMVIIVASLLFAIGFLNVVSVYKTNMKNTLAMERRASQQTENVSTLGTVDKNSVFTYGYRRNGNSTVWDVNTNTTGESAADVYSEIQNAPKENVFTYKIQKSDYGRIETDTKEIIPGTEGKIVTEIKNNGGVIDAASTRYYGDVDSDSGYYVVNVTYPYNIKIIDANGVSVGTSAGLTQDFRNKVYNKNSGYNNDIAANTIDGVNLPSTDASGTAITYVRTYNMVKVYDCTNGTERNVVIGATYTVRGANWDK